MQIEQITYQLTWKIRHEVMWPEESPEFVRLAEDPDGMHYGVFDQNRLCTVVSVFISGDTAQFRKLATRAEFQGRGYATALLQYVFNELPIYGISQVWCNARVEKVSFYQRLGMTLTDQTFSKKGKDYVVMEKELVS